MKQEHANHHVPPSESGWSVPQIVQRVANEV